jgi:hypothetical protein
MESALKQMELSVIGGRTIKEVEARYVIIFQFKYCCLMMEERGNN